MKTLLLEIKVKLYQTSLRSCSIDPLIDSFTSGFLERDVVFPIGRNLLCGMAPQITASKYRVSQKKSSQISFTPSLCVPAVARRFVCLTLYKYEGGGAGGTPIFTHYARSLSTSKQSRITL